MQLFFIRHGQSINNALWDLTGSDNQRSVDAELSEVGKQQAKSLAGFLCQSNPAVSTNRNDDKNHRGFCITHLYCSMMIRAVATATIISEAIGIPPIAHLELYEGGGVYVKDEQSGERKGMPGFNRSYFRTYFPELILPESLGEEGWYNRPCELPEERPLRARRVLADLLQRHGGTDDRVAFVSHGEFYNYFISAVIDIPVKLDKFWFLMNNAAITRLDFRGDGITLVYVNRTDYLPPELIT